MNIAVIPARGGSKRIPRKNIREFCGKPIIAYSIGQAKNSGLFNRIIVSTDDEEIASVAGIYGAETPFIRPQEIADDFTGTNTVVRHAIEWLQQHGQPVAFVCCLYATAPFIQVKYLKQAFEKLRDSNKCFVFSVTSFPFPIQRAIRINALGEVDAFFPEHVDSRSQDLEDAFHDAGQFYWGTAEAFLHNRVLFSSESLPFVLPRYHVQDIDTEEDWRRAEIMFNSLSQLDN